MVDVGFGDSFRVPIEMPDGECEDVSGHYRIYNIDNNKFELQRNEEGEWKLQYSFTTIPRKFTDYGEMCSFQQDSSTSHFRTRMKCTKATPTGRITVSDSSLTITDNGIKTKTEISSEKEFNLLLKEYFGIAFPQG